ncbi:MAG TPA: NfeD family protein [Caulobacterales bacterium]|nr:NfeD family protein [Caulobacterales bacterium]
MAVLWSHLIAAPQLWLGLGLVLLIAELLSGTTYLLWPAVAAAVTALFAAMGAPLVAQICVFALMTILLVVFARPIVRAWLLQRQAGAPVLNDRAASLVGTRASATETFINGVGAVKINDSVWRAKSADAIEAGAVVEVLSVEGTTVTVGKA